MAQIDKFIDALHKYSADHMEVAAGAKVTLGVNGTRRPVTAQAVTLQQIDRLLKEIMPPGAATNDQGGQQFTYVAPSGTVTVYVSRDKGALRLLITPGEGADVPGFAEPGNGGGLSGESTEAAGARAATPTRPTKSSRDPSRMETLFRQMFESGCSDLHISTDVQPLFRKDGDIVPLNEQPALSASEVREMLLSITPPHKAEEFERTNDTDFAYEIPNVARFRCNLFMDRKGMGGVFRVIPTEIKTVDELKLPREIVTLCGLSKGLVLVTGPTGSGKSTTLAALIDHINNTRSDHVVTIEDPIEFVHQNKKCLVNQREVGAHTQSFKVALRAALREDPDVVLVGEMRDLETVAIAIETAETGHLVFGTLHTNTAPSTVDRIIDQFAAEQQAQIRTMLSESLKGVISQTLVKGKKGGRVAAIEFLMVTSAVSNLIREGKTYQIPSIMQTSKSMGMRTLNDAFLELVLTNKVTPEEAYNKSIDRAELEALFQRNGITIVS